MSAKQLVQQLNAGILPDGLNYALKPSNEFDITELKYNWFYRDYSYFASKFPPGFEKIPGFDNIIENMIQINLNTSPLEEINKISTTNITDVSSDEIIELGQIPDTDNQNESN